MRHVIPYLAWIVVGLMLHGCVPVPAPPAPPVSYKHVTLDDGTPCVVAYSHDTPQSVAFGFTCEPKKVAATMAPDPGIGAVNVTPINWSAPSTWPAASVATLPIEPTKPNDVLIGLHTNGVEVVNVRANGRVYLQGVEVHTDPEYRRAMMAIMKGAMGCQDVQP